MDVVDRNDDRLTRAQEIEHIVYGNGERAIVGGLARGVAAQKRDLQRSPPRRGQLADHIVEDTVEEIAEPNVRQSALGLGRTRDEHDKPAFACRRDRLEPKRRFPDPGLAFEHESGRGLDRTVEERVDGLELSLPSHNLTCHDRHRQSCTPGAEITRPHDRLPTPATNMREPLQW